MKLSPKILEKVLQNVLQMNHIKALTNITW